MPQLEVLRPRPDLKEAPASFFLSGAPTPGSIRLTPFLQHIAMTPDALGYPGGRMPHEM